MILKYCNNVTVLHAGNPACLPATAIAFIIRKL